MDENKDKWNLKSDRKKHEPKQNEEVNRGSEEFVEKNPVHSGNGEDIDIQKIKTAQLNNNIVLFVGPKSSGKTAALMRLARYLKYHKETKIEPNKLFRTDERYQKSVSNFLEDFNNPNFSPDRTGEIDFLVLDVYKGAEIHCQFLETSGEAFFNPDNPYDSSFRHYIEQILENSQLNKIFVFFFEDNMLSESDPNAYSDRLAQLATRMNRKKDDVIVIYNKVDQLRGLFRGNRPNSKAFRDRLYHNPDYSSFFEALKVLGIPVKFVPFYSGVFQDIPDEDTKQRWIQSDNFYPAALWRTIERCFKAYRIWWWNW